MMNRILLLIISLLLLGTPLFSQGFQTDFGKNRVQYNEFEWNFYETENFIVYFYQGGQDLAKFALQVAENELEGIEDKLEHRLNTKIELLVYHNMSDLRQTNVGIGYDWSNRGGLTQIVGSKVFVQYNGSHQHLRKQLIEGIARVHFESLTFGSSLQEIVQNAVLLNLPEWFTNGLIAYISEEWNYELDNELRLLVEKGEQPQVHRLTDDEARFVGHSLWHFISENYGESSIPNILYLTRINRSVDSGFSFVLGAEVEEVIEEWWNYCTTMAGNNDPNRMDIASQKSLIQSKKKHRDRNLERLKISPDGKWIAYTSNEIGKLRVHLFNRETGEENFVLKSNFKTYNLPVEDNYPLIAWNEKSGSARKLGIIYEKRDVIYLLQYHPETGEKEEAPISKFQQVLDFDYTSDDRRLVMSAVKNGQSDLYTYFIPNTKTRQLTNDFYDDLDLSYAEVGGRKGVVFSSNRTDDTLRLTKLDTLLPLGNNDIYFFDLEASFYPLIQLTQTPLISEQKPTKSSDGFFNYLAESNGIYNRYAVEFDSSYIRTDQIVYFKDSMLINPDYTTEILDSLQAIGLIDSINQVPIYQVVGTSYPQSNYRYHLLNYDIAPDGNTVVELGKKENIYTIYEVPWTDQSDSINLKLRNTSYRKQVLKKTTTTAIKTSEEKEDVAESTSPLLLDELQVDSSRLDTLSYFFQSEFDWYLNPPEEGLTPTFDNTIFAGSSNKKEKNKKKPIQLSRVRTYSPRFAVDYLAGQLDNSILAFSPYENIGAPNPFNPQIKAMFQVGVSDLFEDYKVSGGFRLPFDLNQFEYFVRFSALEKQLDKEWLFFRRTQNYAPDAFFGGLELKSIHNYLQNTYSYPLDITRRIGLGLAYRQDKVAVLSTEQSSLNAPTTQEQWLMLKLEHVFDNTVGVTTNVLDGMRYKFYVEFHKKFSATINDSEFDFKWNEQGWFGTIGGDIRHYQRIHRQLIWANRFSFGVSFGNQELLYYLGGVHNMLFGPKFNNTTPINPNGTANYAFQSQAPHLRGFGSNVRNGSKHVLWNSEIRFPVFTYLLNRPIKSLFIRNFMITGFMDMGTAWEKGNPFSEENRYITETVSNPLNPSVIAQIRYYRNPIVTGYGYGFRTSLLGYYIKVDRAWGRDSGLTNDGVFYFSVGMDF